MRAIWVTCLSISISALLSSEAVAQSADITGVWSGSSTVTSQSNPCPSYPFSMPIIQNGNSFGGSGSTLAAVSHLSASGTPAALFQEVL